MSQALRTTKSAFNFRSRISEAVRKPLSLPIAAYRQALTLPDEQITTRVGDTDWVITNSYAIAHNGLGLALQKQGKLEAAIKEFELAISVDDSFITAKDNLKKAQERAGL